MNVHRTFGQRLGAVLLSLILALTMMTTMIPSAVKAAPGTGTIYIGGMTGSVIVQAEDYPPDLGGVRQELFHGQGEPEVLFLSSAGHPTQRQAGGSMPELSV